MNTIIKNKATFSRKRELSNGRVEFNITPEPAFLNVLSYSGYKTHEAINDIADNGIDADATKIKVYFGDKNKRPYLIIGDNGHGMTEDILGGALVIGASSKQLGSFAKNGVTLGKFGTGLKSSLLTLRGTATILTKMQGGKLLKTIFHKDSVQEHFDKTGEWGISIAPTTAKEDLELFKEYTGNSSHGTVILVENIKRFTNSYGQAKRQIKSFAKTYQLFNKKNLQITVNNKIVDFIDLAGYHIKFKYDGNEYKSEKIRTEEISGISYVDKQGNKRDDGVIYYRSFLLPQRNQIPGDRNEFTKKYDASYGKQGFLVYRSNRLIQSNSWLGLSAKQPTYNRFRAEIHFSGDLDDVMGCDFKKTSVDPEFEKMKEVKLFLMDDMKKARKAYSKYKSSLTTIKNYESAFSKLSKSINQFFKKEIQRTIPILPVTKISTEKKESINTRIKGKHVNKTDRFTLRERTDFGNSTLYETSEGVTKNSVEIQWNANHIFYKEYVKEIIENDSKSALSLHLFIAAEHWAQQKNLIETSRSSSAWDKRQQEFEALNRDKGSWLDRIWKDAPKEY